MPEQVQKLTAQTRVHLVGIGGTGLSAIARVLLERGIPVSGSDRAINPVTDLLEALGATIHLGHRAENIEGAALLLVTSAVKNDNPEIVAALEAGLPVMKRRDFLPLLLGGDTVIGIAGTHGKTTTTAMTTHILREAGMTPGYIVGSVMKNTGTNADGGGGGKSPFVIEADEYDDMYLGLTPRIAVITGIEWDHPDFFPTEGDMVRSFDAFIGQIQPDGVLIASADTPYSLALARQHESIKTVLYGRDREESDWFIHNLYTTPDGLTCFEAIERATLTAYPFKLKVPGAHNALNALAATLAAAAACGVTFESAAKALESFESTGRRFQVMGEVKQMIVVDDYGHHPSAIRVTLEAARQRYPDHTLWAVWQPHTFSRTRALMSDYARCFSTADGVAVMDIYASREQPVPEVSGQIAAAQIAHHHPNAHYTGDIAATIADLKKRVTGKSVVIVFSAGDAIAVSAGLLADS